MAADKRLTITILGQVPSQKNSKQIFINRKTGKPFISSNTIVKNWQAIAANQLAEYQGQAEGRVSLGYKFFVRDNRPRDIDNMIASCNDALVKAGLLISDSWQHLKIAGADAEIDRENPRVELTIKEKLLV